MPALLPALAPSSSLALWPLVDGLARGLQTQADAARTRIAVAVPPTPQVRAQRGRDDVRCEVRDHGPGIGSGRLAHPFDGRPGERIGHRGLGLSIARRFIEAQGRRIAVHSGAQGTTFQIDPPAGDAPMPG